MKANRLSMLLFVLFLVYSLVPVTVLANQLPSSNTASLVVAGKTITFNGWDLNSRGPGSTIIQADNWDSYETIADNFNNSLLFGGQTPWNNYAAFSGLNSTHFSQILFNCTEEFGTIVNLDVNSSSYLRESLKTAISSLFTLNESSEFCFRPFSEDNLLIPFLWDRSYTGGSLVMGDIGFSHFKHENASVLVNESHWEFALKINTTVACYPSPSDPIYSFTELSCIVCVSLDGTIIAIEHLVPPCGVDPTTTTTTETTTPVGIHPLHALGIGAAVGAVVVIVIFYVKKQK
ncbi:MAG: hypothetical protein GF309_11555 [Candidatus Lokiarchaeota archaeon]|nr:hypothetical protein [Candidatus Lokiarchaeota archaeon]